MPPLRKKQQKAKDHKEDEDLLHSDNGSGNKIQIIRISIV